MVFMVSVSVPVPGGSVGNQISLCGGLAHTPACVTRHYRVVSDSAWTTVSVYGHRERKLGVGAERLTEVTEGACPPPCPGRAVRPLPHPWRDPTQVAPALWAPGTEYRPLATVESQEAQSGEKAPPPVRMDLVAPLREAGAVSGPFRWEHRVSLGPRTHRRSRQQGQEAPLQETATVTGPGRPAAAPALSRSSSASVTLPRARASGRAPGSYRRSVSLQSEAEMSAAQLPECQVHHGTPGAPFAGTWLHQHQGATEGDPEGPWSPTLTTGKTKTRQVRGLTKARPGQTAACGMRPCYGGSWRAVQHRPLRPRPGFRSKLPGGDL